MFFYKINSEGEFLLSFAYLLEIYSADIWLK